MKFKTKLEMGMRERERGLTGNRWEGEVEVEGGK